MKQVRSASFGLLAIALLCCAPSSLLSQSAPAPAKDEAVILAVMPFRSVGDSVALNLGAAFSETLTTKLVGVRGLKVYERAQFEKVTGELSVQRDSAELFDAASVAKAGSIVSMDYMVVGSVTLAGKQVSCQLRLVRVRDGQAAMSQQFLGAYPGDLFSMQDAIALKVIDALKLNLSELEKRKVAKAPTKSFDSWSLYNRSLGNLGTAERIKLLESALAGDPGFTQAAHLLADLYTATNKPDMARHMYDGILALDPCDYRALYNGSLLSFDAGNLDHARSQMERCLAVKDGDPDVYYHLGLFSEFDGAGNRLAPDAPVEAAYGWYLKSLGMDPMHRESLEGAGMLGIALAQRTEDPERQLAYLEASQKYLKKYIELSPDSDESGELAGALDQVEPLIPQLRDYLSKRKKA
jgi:TolB-like protein